MSNRTAKFVSAIFASFLAGAPLTTISHSATRATDDCLSGPKGQTPEAATGTTASITPPNGIAGISQRSATSLRKPPCRIRLHRRIRIHRQKQRRNVRSRTRAPNSPRRPVSTSRSAAMRLLRRCQRMQRSGKIARLRGRRPPRYSDRSSLRAGPIRRVQTPRPIRCRLRAIRSQARVHPREPSRRPPLLPANSRRQTCHRERQPIPCKCSWRR